MDSFLMDFQMAFSLDSNEFESTPINMNITSHLDVRNAYSFNTYTKCKKFHVSSSFLLYARPYVVQLHY